MSSEMTGAIADRYAAALFDLAEQQGAFDQVAADLKTLRAMIADSVDLQRMLRSPIISRQDQQKGMLALARKAALSETTGRFLGLVARNRRLFVLPGMIDSFLARLAVRRGEVTAQVVAAQALNESQRGDLVATLKKAVGSNVAINEQVDPSLLGGMIVKIGSRMVDSSLRTKLQHLQLAMKGVG